MAGGTASDTVGDSFENIAKNVRAEREAQKGIVGSLYDKVAATPATVSRGAIDDLPGRMVKALSDKDIALHPELTKASQIVYDEIAEKVAKMPKDITGLSIKAIEQERRILNNRIDSAVSPSDKRALMTMKNAFDDWYNDLAENAIIKGDAKVIDAMKSARASNTALRRLFESGDESDIGGKVLDKMLAGEMDGDQLAQAALGAAQVSKVAGSSFVRKLKGALKPEVGPMNPAWGELKAAVLKKLTAGGKGGEVMGPQAISNNIKEALRNRKGMMQELYTPEEINGLWKTATILEAMVPRKTSGTAERSFLFGQIEQFSKMAPPTLRDWLKEAFSAPGQAATARNAFKPVQKPLTTLNPLVTASGAAYGQQKGQ
jgi:hypothetical protein